MLREDAPEHQPPADLRDARPQQSARAEKHLPREAAEAEDVGAQKAIAREFRRELALDTVRHVLGQQQHAGRTDGIFLQFLCDLPFAERGLARPCAPCNKSETSSHVKSFLL